MDDVVVPEVANNLPENAQVILIKVLSAQEKQGVRQTCIPYSQIC